MEVDKLKEDPNPELSMSGAYIRSLVKHLKTKDPINPNSSSSSSSSSSNTNPSKMAENQKPQHQKKQVRRRLHTSRPYQERVLNMAEARREIVTALKYHRAAMKKAAGEQSRQPQTPSEPPARCQEGKIRGRKIPKSTAERNNFIDPRSNFNYNNNNSNNNNSRNLSYPWMMNSYTSWSVEENNLEIVLPEQTLGLNLNLQDFKNLEAKVIFSKGSVSGSSSSSSPSLSIGRDEEGLNPATEKNTCGGGGMHVAVGEEEMAKIRSIGEKHSVEWSDKMNLVKSAWWLRFMKMEEGGVQRGDEGFEFGDPFFDQIILEFPDWMSDEEQQLFNDYHFFHHPSASVSASASALPCMDIGEFEGMDGEWLA